MSMPMRYKRVHLTGPVEASVLPTGVTFPAAARAEVERLWAAEKAKRGKTLFNGQSLCARTVAGGRIECVVTEYKYVLAQLRERRLFADLGLRPLAVNGIIVADGAAILGHRSAAMTQDPSTWEAMPSGGVDPSSVGRDGRVDFRGHILKEFEEETGVSSSLIAKAEVIGLFEDSTDHVVEVCLRLTPALGLKELLSRFDLARSAEYDEARVVPLADLKGTGAAAPQPLLALTGQIAKELL